MGKMLYFHTSSNSEKLGQIFLLSLSSFACRHGPDDVGISWVSDGHGADPEVLSAGSTQLDVVSSVVVDTSLGQHGIVFNLRLPERFKMTS